MITEKIIHYNYIKEIFFEYNTRYDTATDCTELTLDEFKNKMSNNEQVGIKRNALFIKENVEKNTVTFERINFEKRLVKVNNLKRKKFKIITKEIEGLTINKITGDFYIFEISRKNKGEKYKYIRSNLSTAVTKGILKNLTDSNILLISETVVKLAIETFFNVLNINSNIITEEDLIKFYYPNYINTINSSSTQYLLLRLPFINYIHKHNININNYYNLLSSFEEIFKKNKKKYYNGNMIDFYSDHYKIKNKNILQLALSQLSKKYSQGNYKSNTFIDPLIINICDLYYNDIRLIDTYNYIRSDINHKYHNCFNFIQTVLKLYNFRFDDVYEWYQTKESFFPIMEILYCFSTFNIKIKCNKIYDIIVMKSELIILLEMVYSSRNISGTIVINDTFYKRINHYLKSNELISFDYLSNIKTTFRLMDIMLIDINILNKDDKKVLSTITVNAYQEPYITHQRSSDNTEHLLNKILYTNKDSILNDLTVKNLYSKKIFEDKCKEEKKLKLCELFGYIN